MLTQLEKLQPQEEKKERKKKRCWDFRVCLPPVLALGTELGKGNLVKYHFRQDARMTKGFQAIQEVSMRLVLRFLLTLRASVWRLAPAGLKDCHLGQASAHLPSISLSAPFPLLL